MTHLIPHLIPLGNSVPVAMNYYAMATAESFRQAIEMPSSTGGGSVSGSNCGSIKEHAETIGSCHEAQKHPDFVEETKVLMATRGVQMDGIMGDIGLEPTTPTISNQRSYGQVSP